MIFSACASISRPGVSLLEIDIWLDCSYTTYYKISQRFTLINSNGHIEHSEIGTRFSMLCFSRTNVF